MKSYSDLKEEIKPVFENADRIYLAEVLNKKIIIKDFKALPSTLTTGKEFVIINAEVDKKDVSFSCGEVVLKQLREVQDSLPITATITREKGKRYYTLK